MSRPCAPSAPGFSGGAGPAPPALDIDASRLKCQRTLGVSHVVSELLLLHRAGASVWLRHVNGPLRRCLHLLRLDGLFHLT
ncbi:hypothetical protein ACFQT0_22065 [Hymenobacter humi]|uniref:STAS domain-containing protein n=1 Tax=Hymenobacter humi TaxID=1411620 RepID=A0ABW2U8B3_9BACT